MQTTVFDRLQNCSDDDLKFIDKITLAEMVCMRGERERHIHMRERETPFTHIQRSSIVFGWSCASYFVLYVCVCVSLSLQVKSLEQMLLLVHKGKATAELLEKFSLEMALRMVRRAPS